MFRSKYKKNESSASSLKTKERQKIIRKKITLVDHTRWNKQTEIIKMRKKPIKKWNKLSRRQTNKLINKHKEIKSQINDFLSTKIRNPF